MTDRTLNAAKLLTHIVTHPESYGEPLAVTQLGNGGMTFAPVTDHGEVDEHRRIILDAKQVSDLSARLNMDPHLASRIVSDYIINNMPDMGGAVTIYACLMGIIGMVVGAGLNAIFF